MEEALRKILEAVEKNEISVDEAVELIQALKERTEREKRNDFGKTGDIKDLIVDRIFVDENETFEGDVVIVDGEAVVKGAVKGNLSIISGKLFFSGEVLGDLNAVSSKIEWHGGIVHGSLYVIACKEEGTPPRVEGELVRFDNVFIRSVMSFVKPFIQGIKTKKRR